METPAAWVNRLLSNQSLSPHGICLLWRPELIWTHVAADLVIGVAYFSIPLALVVFLHRRPDIRFGWAIWMFVAFILLCGVTHFFSIWTLWHADYGAEALVKAVTAAASIATAIALWPLLPKAIAWPSPEALQRRIDERDVALRELSAAMASMVEMQEHQARQKLLLDELNHRVKNTLTVVQSIAQQTISGAEDYGQFRSTFLERLLALSDTHTLLVKSEWRGAAVRDLIEETLRPFGRPYVVTGADIQLGPNFAVSLGLAFHELATNALKHGAWSGSGLVRIVLENDPGGRHICIHWREEGGPPVLAQPPRRGFGSRLLERGVGREIGGSVTLDFHLAGLTCSICAPATAQFKPAPPNLAEAVKPS